MKGKWKIILIAILILPCLFFWQGCTSGGDGDSNAPTLTYVVSFYTDSKDDFNYPNQTVQYGRLVRKPSNPVKKGYIFNGWYRDQERTIPWNFEVDTVSGNMTLYADWVEKKTDN